MSCLASSATWEHPQWVATMFVTSKKKEGEWNWERYTRVSKSFLWSVHLYRAGCVFKADNTCMSLPCVHFPWNKWRLLQIVDVMSRFWFLWGLCWNVPSTLCLLFQISVHLGAWVLYLALFIWASPNFLSFSSQKLIKLWADSSIASLVVLILAVILGCS